MILPIYVYGSAVLREKTVPVKERTPELVKLAEDMIDTMHAASGIGLAATQVGRLERLFVVDLSPMAEDLLEETGEVPSYARGPVVFVNPEIRDAEACETVQFEEGCLSIPEIREAVQRPDRIHVRYLDLDFQPHEMTASGLLARVLQHEFDHLEGVLFIDRIGTLRRRMLQRRLRAMARGEVEADYLLATD
jgi:peptide deformylase